MAREIDPDTLHAALLDGAELALIDCREEGQYGANHILRAVNISLSRLDVDLKRLVPNLAVRLVLMDDDADRLSRAVTKAEVMGYSNLSILPGGAEAWVAAGREAFSGLNVPSKVFGEYIEHHYDTPRIEATDLKALMDAGEKIVILDSRPMDEYHAMNIPTGIDVPGAELVYRARDLVPDDETLVVVNCAGRTRSIIGCQSLVNAGLPNPVVALKNGTMGWYLSGLKLEKGASRVADEPGDAGRQWAAHASSDVAHRFGVEAVAADQVPAWMEDRTRTTYLLDVRTVEEFESGRLPGARHAPGGQLVQATDRYVGVQNARIILIDDQMVRAQMTASWLVQMGWPDVFVVDNPDPASFTESGSVRESVLSDENSIEASALAELGETLFLDISTSLIYKKCHIEGAAWIIRSRLKDDLKPDLAEGKTLVIYGASDDLAALTAADLIAAGHPGARWLKGGLAAYQAVGGPTGTGMENALSPIEDLYYRPYDRDHGVEQAMKAYLDWEIALVEQLERDRTLVFPNFTSE